MPALAASCGLLHPMASLWSPVPFLSPPRTDICFEHLLGIEKGTQSSEDLSGLCASTGRALESSAMTPADICSSVTLVPLPSLLHSRAQDSLCALGT